VGAFETFFIPLPAKKGKVGGWVVGECGFLLVQNFLTWALKIRWFRQKLFRSIYFLSNF